MYWPQTVEMDCLSLSHVKGKREKRKVSESLLAGA
jgi:hypothetical protein